MANYKLKALSVSGLGNKVYRIEDNQVLTDAHFPAGRAEQLVAAGFLEKVQEGKAADKKTAKAPAPKAKEAKPEAPKAPAASDKPEAPKPFEGISYQELKEYLTKKAIPFKPAGESRKNLYELYVKSFSAIAPATTGTDSTAAPATDTTEKITPVAIEEINVADLEKHLTEKGVSFDTEEDKEALYAKYLTTFA